MLKRNFSYKNISKLKKNYNIFKEIYFYPTTKNKKDPLTKNGNEKAQFSLLISQEIHFMKRILL